MQLTLQFFYYYNYYYQILLLLFCQIPEIPSLEATSTTAKGRSIKPATIDNLEAEKNMMMMMMKREPDPSSCDPHPACKTISNAIGGQENAISKILFPQTAIFKMQKISSENEGKNGNDDDEEKKKKLEEAKAIATSSANKLFEIIQNSNNGQLNIDEFVGLMASANSSVVQLFGGPFGAVFTGVRYSLVMSNDPVLQVLAALNSELDLQCVADADKLDEMQRQMKRHYTTICYNGKVMCIMDLLQPIYKSLTTPSADIDDPKVYAENVNNFLALCKNENIAYFALNYIRASYEFILMALYDDAMQQQKDVQNLLMNTAKMIQIHAIKMVAMATLCTEFRNLSGQVYRDAIMAHIDNILNGMSAWIQQHRLENPTTSSPPDRNGAAAIHHLLHPYHYYLHHQQLTIISVVFLVTLLYGMY